MHADPAFAESAHAVAEAIAAIVWVGEEDGSAEYFNQRASEYTGRSSEELSGRGWLKLIHPEDLPSPGDVLDRGGGSPDGGGVRRASEEGREGEVGRCVSAGLFPRQHRQA